jgi:hypothetical protein
MKLGTDEVDAVNNTFAGPFNSKGEAKYWAANYYQHSWIPF